MHKTIVAGVWVGAVLIITFIAVALGLRKSDVGRYDRSSVWSVDRDSGAGVLVRGRNITSIRKDPARLVIAFNRAFADAAAAEEERSLPDLPHLRLQKVDDGVATIEIVNSEYLSERMGSSGSQDFLAAATYTLTECPQVRTVSFLFPGGDHAVPGEYSRESFGDYTIAAGREKR